MARIYKQKGSRKWYSDFCDPQHPRADKNGRVRVPLHRDQKIALDKLNEMIKLSEAKDYGDRTPADISYQEFKKKFLDWVEVNKAKATYIHDRAGLTALEAKESPKYLADIKPEVLERVQGAMKADGEINSLINRRIRSVKAMMRKAEDWGYVKPQKWETIRQLPEPKGRLLFYSPQESKALIEQCRGVWRTIALLGIRAGLRRGEIYWLDWASVDTARNRLHIAPRYGENGELLWSPKDHERRWIPMAVDLRNHLSRIPRSGRWVIQEDGKRLSIGVVSTYFKRLSTKANLTGNIHTLRHTFASHLASSGKVTLREIQELLGHDSIEQTQIYTHLMPDRVEAAVTHLPEI